MAVLVPFVLLFGGISFADEKASIVRSGETAVRATVSNRTVQASIKTQMKKIKVYESETDATAPERSTVEAIEIRVNGNRILVPVSVTDGLITPLEASLQVGSPLSILTVLGGDTSAAYIVKIEFDSKRVRRKIVASQLIPDKPTQVTTYYLRTLEDK